MKPSRIRVFDGLRITTEHVNHLQSALSSGIEDLRVIAGWGIVRGLDVSVDETATVTVAPGMAFDRQGNRIVCDDPLTARVSFKAEDETQYVCLKYEQVENGKVEGQSTLIFDGCSIALQPALPGPRDPYLAIARVVNDPAGVKVALLASEALERSESAGQTKAPALQVQQGIERIRGNLLEIPFSGEPDELERQEIPLEFSPASLTSKALLSATVTLLPESSAEGPAEPPQTEFHFECHADGETTFGESDVIQFSISSSAFPDVSESDLARLFLDLPVSSGLDSLRAAYLALRLARSDAGTIELTCVLGWSAVPSDETVNAIRDRKPSVSWQALVGWKALGVSATT
jgi:hypothetical protein